jgi:hypothetical protein
MRSTRTPAPPSRGRRTHRTDHTPRTRRTALVATGLVAALALTATACNGSDDNSSGKPDGTITASASGGDGKLKIPSDIASKLKDHGIDVDEWAKGGWKNWDKDKWLSQAKDFVNPVIEGLWKPERMQSAKEANKTVSTKDAAADQGVSDPEPAPVQARPRRRRTTSTRPRSARSSSTPPRARWSARAR